MILNLSLRRVSYKQTESLQKLNIFPEIIAEINTNSAKVDWKNFCDTKKVTTMYSQNSGVSISKIFTNLNEEKIPHVIIF